MANDNKLNHTIDDSVVDYIVYSETNDYQRKNYHSRYFLAFIKAIQPQLLRNETITVLDAPCGSGVGTYYLAEQISRYTDNFKIIGVDLCKPAIEYAVANYTHPNIAFIQDDILNVIDSTSFDSFVCMEFLEHVPMETARAVIERSQEKLNDGGIAIFSSPRLRPRESTVKRGGHINEFSEQEFYYTLEEYYPMVERHSFDRYANIVNYTTDSNLMVGVCRKWNTTEVFV